jgi:lysophospholipase L1-like esterase
MKGLKMKQFKGIIILCGVFLLTVVGGFFLMTLLFGETVVEENHETTQPSRHTIHLIALGDSLTEGIGDSTNRGGYVPLVSEYLRRNEQIRQVTTRNHGRAGATTIELLELLHENEDIQADIERANTVAITIGGNDIIRTFRQTGLESTLEDFQETLAMAHENVEEITQYIHSLNEDVEIYVFGLYNPYHYYFADFEELQSIFDSWNESIIDLANDVESIHYVEIDSSFNPIDMEGATEEELAEVQDLEDVQDHSHPYLYEEDLFHPNDAGYQLMADALYETITINLDIEQEETN